MNRVREKWRDSQKCDFGRRFLSLLESYDGKKITLQNFWLIRCCSTGLASHIPQFA